MDKFTVLKQYFGYDRFKPGQEAVIDRLSAGGDAICVMPTGAGKSLCYQVPALMADGLTLVISPLISLMHDQVDALRACGVQAAYLNSALDAAQYREVLSGVARGVYRILYCAPERLDAPSFQAALRAQRISLIAVDEAHCVSQWGQDFRPSYLKIAAFIDSLPYRPPVGAFTATATAQVRDDIERLLSLRSPLRMTTGFDRPNLYFAVLQPDDKDAALTALLRQRADRSGIVYCLTRKAVENVTSHLHAHGIQAARYHAGLSDAERKQSQADFLYDRVPVMVATNAFGMGIDKPNVGFVIHYQMPMDLESYYQEAGRAGRDGEKADCILLYSPQDVRTCRYLIDNSEPNPDLDAQTQEELHARALSRLRAMVHYCRQEGCLRAEILRYFGEAAADYCGGCSNCEGGYTAQDITLDAQKIISCIVRAGQKYDRHMLIALLSGQSDEKIRALGLDRLSTFGILSDRSPEQLARLIEELLAQGVLRRGQEDARIIGLAPRAAAVIREGEKVEMRSPLRASAQESARDDTLFEILKRVRARLAMRASVQPYMVFSDKTLREMSAVCPHTQAELLRISGVGTYKARRYGKAFLEAIDSYLKTQHGEASPAARSASREWSAQEDALLRELFAQDAPMAELMRRLGRSRARILQRMRALGMIFEE